MILPVHLGFSPKRPSCAQRGKCFSAQNVPAGQKTQPQAEKSTPLRRTLIPVVDPMPGSDVASFHLDSSLGSMKTYCFDIDGTICSQEDQNYSLATPILRRVESINKLRELGHVVKFFTARGSTSGIDWTERTEEQLRSWGLGFDELIMGKPHADVFVDDKGVHPDHFFR